MGWLADMAGVPPLCVYDHVAEFKSPKGNKVAKLGYSDCGAITKSRLNITIFDVESGNEYGGMFGLSGMHDELNIHWENERTLVVSHFPLKDLLWFNQKYESGVNIKLANEKQEP